MAFAVISVSECSGNNVERELTSKMASPREMIAKWLIIRLRGMLRGTQGKVLIVVDAKYRVEDLLRRLHKYGRLNELVLIVVNYVAGNRLVMMCNLNY
jgi:hypothetical protein